jgi:hypothetical protein
MQRSPRLLAKESPLDAVANKYKSGELAQIIN